MSVLIIKRKCGRNERLTEDQADNLAWQEDHSFICSCEKKLPYKGYGDVGNFGAVWLQY